MSDFDKEAERERLRKQYEQDREKRETTEKMSELLLQGATMTNAHCSECNDPIFRYDGQEFCASCEKPVNRGTAGDDADEGEAGGSAIEVTSPSDEARVSFGANSAESVQEDGDANQSTTQSAGETDGAETPREDGYRQQERHTHQEDTPTRGQGTAPRSREQTARQPDDFDEPTVPSTDSAETGVIQARESLIRSLTRFSQQAEACEDPKRAREYLTAAREAAETLDALGR